MNELPRNYDYFEIKRMTKLPDSEVNEIMRMYGYHEHKAGEGRKYKTRLVVNEHDLCRALKRRKCI